LQSQANANGLQSEDLPDAIVALDQGVIYHSAMAKRCPFAKLLEEHEPGYPEDLFIEFKFRERSEIPAFFIWLLCSFPSPEPTWEGFMVGKYLSFRSVDATVVFGAPHDDQT
jgi:hypothetical protein